MIKGILKVGDKRFNVSIDKEKWGCSDELIKKTLEIQQLLLTSEKISVIFDFDRYSMEKIFDKFEGSRIITTPEEQDVDDESIVY